MILPPIAAPSAGSEPYVMKTVRGWTVHMERRIGKERPRLAEAALQELSAQLARIERVVPDAPLRKIKTVPFWLHLENPANVGAAFHPSREWLVEHKQNPAMANGIEIGDMENFVTWTCDQPWMVMHELAHAFHFRFLPEGAENPDVFAALEPAIASHRYESVLHVSGRTDRAYALTNQMEYFAETTEAFFGQNDFYLFVRAELKTFDPAAEAMMRKLWGDPVVRLPKG